MSYSQELLWLLDRLWPGRDVYNVPRAMRLRGPLFHAALKQALDALVQRHEVLRTRFPAEDGQPYQFIPATDAVELRVIDLQDIPAELRAEEAERLARAETQRPFDLARDLLLRALLIQLDADDHVLVVVLHHIVSDGWSRRIFAREFTELYEAILERRPPQLRELPLQYADFAIWQRSTHQQERVEQQLAYWREALDGAPPLLEVPADRARPSVQSFRGGRERRALPDELLARVKELSRREGVTTFMTLLAAFQALLSRYTGQTDIVVGTPIAGRDRTELEELIGYFSNELVLRTDLSGEPTFREVLRRARNVVVGALAHQEVPFARLVTELKPERLLSSTPIFQVVFSTGNRIESMLDFSPAGLDVAPVLIDRGISKFDLTLGMTETADGLVAGYEYNADLFDSATICRMLEHLEYWLSTLLTEPDRPISTLPVVPPLELRRVVQEWSGTSADFSRHASVHELFETQVDRTPDASAVEFGDQRVSYAELNRRANQLAHFLRSRGVKPDDLVCVAISRSIDMVVALLGILKSGGAYVPLDPSYPRERLAALFDDVQPRLVLTHSRHAESLPCAGTEVVCLDVAWPAIASESFDNPAAVSAPHNLAYVIYTSGSTGQPKGVMIEHHSLVNFTEAAVSEYAITDADRVLQFASLTFDTSAEEIYPCLISGATLVLRDDAIVGAPAAFADSCAVQRISVLDLPTAYWHELAANVDQIHLPASLRLVIIGGETALPERVAAWQAAVGGRVELINTYGPTEATVVATCHRIPAALPAEMRSRPVPIGKPLRNVRAYVLDGQLQVRPIGMPGELCLAGEGIARGYLNQLRLTAERFVTVAVAPECVERVYRTGDLARWTADGDLEFVGRTDTQVKLRGFRIELGEIEAVLSQHPAVSEVVAAIHETHSGNKQVIAYVAVSGPQPPADVFRQFLKERLPEFMVPSAFVVVKQFPRTSNGKIARDQLPDPSEAILGPASETLGPRDEIEAGLVAIWEDLFSARPISIRDDFFALGGHSLMAVRLVAEVHKRFGKLLTLSTLFQSATVEDLARVIRQPSTGPATAVVALQPRGERPPFFCLHGIGGEVLCFAKLAAYFGDTHPFYALEAIGLDGMQEPPDSLESMAAYYIRHIRQLQPHGPYFLGGYSSGGTVALEIARQLRESGLAVALLAILDSPSPKFNYWRPSWTPQFWRGLTSNLLRNLGYWADTYRQLPSDQKLKLLRQRVRYAQRNFRGLLARRQSTADTKSQMQQRHAFVQWLGQQPGLEALSQWPAHRLRMIDAELRALNAYEPRVYPGEITLYRARRQPLICSYEPTKGWGRLTSQQVRITEVPGSHHSIIEEPYVQALAAALKRTIDAAVAEASTRQHEAPA